jgi:hypothetical protein
LSNSDQSLFLPKESEQGCCYIIQAKCFCRSDEAAVAGYFVVFYFCAAKISGHLFAQNLPHFHQSLAILHQINPAGQRSAPPVAVKQASESLFEAFNVRPDLVHMKFKGVLKFLGSCSLGHVA